MEPAPSDRSTLGLPSALARSQAWQRPLHDNSSVQHSITINIDNISKDDDPSLGNTAQEGKHSRKITAEPLTPCFSSKQGWLTRIFVKQQPNRYLLLLFFVKVAAERRLFLLDTIAIF